MVVAAVFAAITSVVCNSLLREEHLGLQFSSVFMALVSFAASIIALKLFMGECYSSINDSTNDDLNWGSGSWIVVAGMFLMGITAVIQLIASLFCK